MGISFFKARLSFQAKVLVPVVTVMVVLIAVTIWLVNRRISDQLPQEAVQTLDTASKIFEKTQDIRRKHLLSQYHNVVNEPRFKATVQKADFETSNNYLDGLVQELRQEDATTKDGPVIATLTLAGGGNQPPASANRDPQLDTSEFQSRSLMAVRQAMEGNPKADTVRVGRRLFDVISIPVTVGGEIAGVLTVGVEIGTETAREIKQVTRSEILLFSDGQVAASSLARPEFYPKLVEKFNELSAAGAAQNPEFAGKILLESEHFIGEAGHFHSLSGDSRLGYLLLSSYEQPLADLRATQQMLLVVGLFGTVLGTAIVWILIRKITQPLRLLRDSAEAVGRGDFSKRVEIHSQDECGKLAGAFNQMTENLQTSRRELEKTVETLKNTQHQLIQSEKLSGIGEFVAGVAHELNNPLTSVMGFAELLQQSDLPEQPRRYLDVIFKSAKRCTKIVQSLLSFARRHAPERKVVSLNEIVESAIEILQYQMRTSNIEVFTQFDPRLPATLVDSHQMQQVFLNIINNARQAMESRQSGGWLRVTTESSDGRVRVIFKDNGPGIPPEHLTKIFNPFFTTKEVGKGTGLGLSLCYGIVSEHGGTITPQSKAGEGATFVIDLPVAREPAGTIQKPAAPAPSLNADEGVGKRVLVIDDEDSILQMVREALMLNGYKVDVVRDGESALRRLSQFHYDLALCDWKMPGLNGQQVYERLYSFNPEMSKRLIFITGDVVSAKTQEFLHDRNKVCLSKPFTLVEFRSAISQVLTPA